jgi:hypothetical protein
MLRPSPTNDSCEISIEQAAATINGMIAERAKEALEGRPTEAAKPALPQPHPPGCYFNLPAATYHADPSLGGGDLKRLLRSPTDYWWESHLNPNRPPDTDSPSKLKGRALHALVLEGEAAFARAFVEEPSPDGHPGALVTLEDLKAKCRELGEPVSGTKAELAKRIRAKDAKAIVFDDILATFRAMVERDGLEVLKPHMMREVRQAAGAMTLNPHLARAFEGGIPEVSVFWVDERGLACKCRLDYLKPRTIVDLSLECQGGARGVDPMGSARGARGPLGEGVDALIRAGTDRTAQFATGRQVSYLGPGSEAGRWSCPYCDLVACSRWPLPERSSRKAPHPNRREMNAPNGSRPV